uniref:Uncharacterized protein AlNc14C214G8978 n=1 Tax=Albugo laibachii Nc14 TaxID=890382 RepID=F0WRH7_9STRA|nr:conserved hypothetical protein [Albugo laibachii Nc14]|eukprot:CCA23940.1 conserved hypothetical protein [Albugo laibachii Nc14]
MLSRYTPTMTRQLGQTILHFDLNRTILMSDTSGSRSIEDTVNYLLAECIWGYVNATAQWVCASTTPSIVSPSPRAITYKQFVAHQLPYTKITEKDQIKDSLKMNAIYDYNTRIKKQRTLLESNFTDPIGPANALRNVFDDTMEKLHFPMGFQRDQAHRLASAFPEGPLKEAWERGRYYLLPSFIELLFELKCNSRFKIVFRTFGEDLPYVAKELDLLADGEHPLCHRGDNHRILNSQFRLHVPTTNDQAHAIHQMGTFLRRGSDSNETALILGALDPIPYNTRTMDPTRPLNEVVLEAYPSCHIIYGFQDIYERLRQLFSSSAQCTFGFRDYWDIWHAHGEHCDFGKLLLIEQDGENVCFFDDHIEADDAHIVDVRDASSGACVPFSVCREKHYLVRVEPYWAIIDPAYFINHVMKRIGNNLIATVYYVHLINPILNDS